ncbi:MAG: hypothetical protein VX675_09765 [Planctomycetota bacterium]|nr:hypothetical protein [Planctomycetota bacterium]
MRTALLLIPLLLSSFFTPAARADIVHLRDGKTIEGKVTLNEDDNTYRIDTTRGSVIKPANDIQRIVKAKLPQEVFTERFASVDRKDLNELASLVTWAREKYLVPQKQKVCGLILKIDPNHEMARRELGYTVFENEWILEKDLRKKQLDLGLVKYKGEWVSRKEHSRLVFKEETERLATLFKSVESDNHIVVDYAVRKIMAYKGKRAYELFTPYLNSPHESVRLVAVSVLSQFPASAGDKGKEPAREAVEAARKLFNLALAEPSPKVLKVTSICLRKFHPDETFRQALETLVKPGDAGTIERAREIATQLLLKKRIPGVFDLLVTTETAAEKGGVGEVKENKEILQLLSSSLGVDHGYKKEDWKKWWKENEWRFRDVP